jgi:hypothetical protein
MPADKVVNEDVNAGCGLVVMPELGIRRRLASIALVFLPDSQKEAFGVARGRGAKVRVSVNPFAFDTY